VAKIYWGDENEWDLIDGIYQTSFDTSRLYNYGTYDFWFVVDGTESSPLPIAIQDPNDLDNDGLFDDWELQFFEDIELYGPGDDPDGDGKVNYSEYHQNSDPTQAGASGMIATYNVTSNQVLSGTIYANLHLPYATLDLNGRTLVVKGDLLLSGGTLDVNGGTLVVEGDCRVHAYTTTNKLGDVTDVPLKRRTIFILNPLLVNGFCDV